jgi:hypothetical protein
MRGTRERGARKLWHFEVHAVRNTFAFLRKTLMLTLARNVECSNVLPMANDWVYARKPGSGTGTVSTNERGPPRARMAWTFHQIRNGILALQRSQIVRVPKVHVVTTPPIQVSGPSCSTLPHSRWASPMLHCCVRERAMRRPFRPHFRENMAILLAGVTPKTALPPVTEPISAAVCRRNLESGTTNTTSDPSRARSSAMARPLSRLADNRRLALTAENRPQLASRSTTAVRSAASSSRHCSGLPAR